MLPCNVVVRALDDTTSKVEAFDPDAMMSFSDGDAIRRGGRRRQAAPRRNAGQPSIPPTPQPPNKESRPVAELKPDDMGAVINRIKRAQGQLGGVLRMLEEGRECEDVVTQLAAVSRPWTAPASPSSRTGLQQCLTNGERHGQPGREEDGEALPLPRLTRTSYPPRSRRVARTAVTRFQTAHGVSALHSISTAHSRGKPSRPSSVEVKRRRFPWVR